MAFALKFCGKFGSGGGQHITCSISTPSSQRLRSFSLPTLHQALLRAFKQPLRSCKNRALHVLAVADKFNAANDVRVHQLASAASTIAFRAAYRVSLASHCMGAHQLRKQGSVRNGLFFAGLIVSKHQ